MKKVDVGFKTAEVISCNAREQSVDIKIIVNDGKDKAVTRKVDLKDPERQAQLIFNDIRDKLKNANKSSGGDSFLDNVVTIRFKQDEEFIVERLGKYLVSLRDKFRTTRFNKISYWDLERQIMSHKASFEDAREIARHAIAKDESIADEEEPPARTHADELGITMMDRPRQKPPINKGSPKGFFK